jgi:hypothetical protein
MNELIDEIVIVEMKNTRGANHSSLVFFLY